MPREDARPRRSLPRSRTSHRRRGINTGVPSRKERARLNTSEHTARLAGRAAQHTPRSGRGSRDLIYGTVHPRVLFITCAGPRLVSLPSAPASALLGCCCSRVRSFAPSSSPFLFPARSLGRSLDALWSLAPRSGRRLSAVSVPYGARVNCRGFPPPPFVDRATCLSFSNTARGSTAFSLHAVADDCIFIVRSARTEHAALCSVLH